MTAQFRDSIDLHEGEKKGLGLWITGSGTSLEDIDLKKLEGQDIISLNSSILLTRKLKASVWWCYYDMRAWSDVRDHLNGVTPLNCYIHRRGCEQMREYKGPARYVVYRDGEFKPERTCLETALMIANFLQYEEVYLVGVDAFGFSSDDRAYAKGIEKTCRFAKEGTPGSFKNSQGSFLEALKKLKVESLHLDVYRVSDIFPENDLFEKATFEHCIERANKWRHSWKPKKR